MSEHGFLVSLTARVNIEESQEARTALEMNAVEYLRAGGVVTPAQWAALSPIEREAMARAGDIIAEERAEYLAAEVARCMGLDAESSAARALRELAAEAAEERSQA